MLEMQLEEDRIKEAERRKWDEIFKAPRMS
jgi:hypothetical protein